MLDSSLLSDPAMRRAVAPSASESHTRRFRAWLVLRILFQAAAVMLIAETLRVFVGNNFCTVVPGRCYRSGQPSADLLKSVQQTHGIRSILNLRDENEHEPWYQREKQAAQRLGLKLVNAGLSSGEQPPDEDFRHFVRSIQACPEPVLIHCYNGSDRTGFASVVYLLLHTDTPFAEARGQLSVRYGHFAFTRASALHRILDNYEAWLDEREHSAARFVDWAEHAYRQEAPR